MNTQYCLINAIKPFGLVMAFFIIMIWMLPAAQAGVYFSYGYGHYGNHYSYSRHAYRYGYPSYYGLHNYGYRPYGYSYPYSYRTYSPAPYIEPTYRREPSTQAYTHGGSVIASSDDSSAWRLLSNDRSSEALSRFSRAAQASPSKGDPKIGYALAAADMGQLDKGVWAMRRALKTDPHALHYVNIDQQLDGKVKRMIDGYEKNKEYSNDKAKDSSFMLASLHYLRRDMTSARRQIKQAMRTGNVSVSTKNMQALIDDEANK